MCVDLCESTCEADACTALLACVPPAFAQDARAVARARCQARGGAECEGGRASRAGLGLVAAVVVTPRDTTCVVYELLKSSCTLILIER